MTQIATFIFIVGILGLFFLNRDPEEKTSKALWIPVVWLLIIGSRPVSVWLQMAPPSSADQYLDGSPLDRNVYIGLLALGLIVLFNRRTAVAKLLRSNLLDRNFPPVLRGQRRLVRLPRCGVQAVDQIPG